MPLLLWTVFGVVVIGLLALDLAVFRRGAHEVKPREALVWSAVWIGLALAFDALVWVWRGPETALGFLTGYLIEKALSIDHLFVFLLIFSAFRVPDRFQHKVLFWGIIGAFAMRLGLIALGVTLIERFEWMLYVFGGFLVLTAARIVIRGGTPANPGDSRLVRAVGRVLPVTPHHAEGRFVVRRNGRLLATPLLIVLVLVEGTDFVFAVDSIPAILAITRDPLVVYTSNVFALLGLRSLYFALSGILPFFHALHYAFAGILAFAGAKMLLADLVTIPIGAALGVVAALLIVAMVASVVRPREDQVQALLEQGAETGGFERAEVTMVERVLRLGDRRVGSLMTARADVVWLDTRDAPEELARKVRRSGASEMPLARGTLDDVVGVVHVADLLAATLEGDRLDLPARARPPLLLPEHLAALQGLARLREADTTVGFVVDEHGTVDGVVTLADIIDAVAGELPGVRPREAEIERGEDGAWLVDGRVALDELTEALELEPVMGEERALHHTVAGLAMDALGRVPSTGDRFAWRDLRFEVVESIGRRARKLRVRRERQDAKAA